jgi:ribosomal protein S25
MNISSISKKKKKKKRSLCLPTYNKNVTTWNGDERDGKEEIPFVKCSNSITDSSRKEVSKIQNVSPLILLNETIILISHL